MSTPAALPAGQAQHAPAFPLYRFSAINVLLPLIAICAPTAAQLLLASRKGRGRKVLLFMSDDKESADIYAFFFVVSLEIERFCDRRHIRPGPPSVMIRDVGLQTLLLQLQY